MQLNSVGYLFANTAQLTMENWSRPSLPPPVLNCEDPVKFLLRSTDFLYSDFILHHRQFNSILLEHISIPLNSWSTRKHGHPRTKPILPHLISIICMKIHKQPPPVF